MATTNSAPHRHTHPSLTRTRRPKKLPAPSPSANANFLESILSSRAAAPSLFVVPRYLLSLAALHAVCHCRSHATRMPFASPASSTPSTQGAQGRSLPRCAISRPRRIFTCDRVRQKPLGGSSGVRSHKTSSLSPDHHALHLPLDSRGVSSTVPRATEPHSAPLSIDAPNPQEQTALIRQS